MAYIVRFGDCEVVCETAEEVRQLVGIDPLTPSKKKKPLKELDGRSRSGAAAKQSWEEAKEYAAQHGIPLVEARQEIAAIRRGEMQARENGNSPKKKASRKKAPKKKPKR